MKSRQSSFLGYRCMFFKADKTCASNSKVHKKINRTKIGVLFVIVFSVNNTVSASVSFSSLSQDKPSYFNDYLVKKESSKISSITYLTLEDKQRLANYEKQYLDEYQTLMQQQISYQVTYIQPVNRAQACKVMVVAHIDYSSTVLQDLKHYWDGECKNGYANGIGREFVKGGNNYSWILANYQEGIPAYYAEKDLFSYTYIEGEFDAQQLTWLGVETDYSSISETKKIGIKDYRTKINLFESYFLDSPETRFLVKEYPNFKYEQIEYTLNSSRILDYEFALHDQNDRRHGWGFYKLQNLDHYGGFEYIDGNFQLKPLPEEFRRRYQYIMDEIHWTKQLALKAQKKALKVKQQYIDQFCHKPNQAMLKELPEYLDICTVGENE